MEQWAVVRQTKPDKVLALWDTYDLAYVDAVARANGYNEPMLVRKVTLTFEETA